MSHLKFFGKIGDENEIYQLLGCEKIKEICEEQGLGKKGQEIVATILSRVDRVELLKNVGLISQITKEEASSFPLKKSVKKVIKDISGLFQYSDEYAKKLERKYGRSGIPAIPKRKVQFLNA